VFDFTGITVQFVTELVFGYDRNMHTLSIVVVIAVVVVLFAFVVVVVVVVVETS